MQKMMRFWISLAVCLLTSQCALAAEQAKSAVALVASVVSVPEPVLLSVDAYGPVLAASQLEEALAAPQSSYHALDSRTIYPLTRERALWLRIRLQAKADVPLNAWTLALPKPFFEMVQLYSQDAQGLWQQQTSGNRIPHALWPVASLNPEFALPALAPGHHDVYLKIQENALTRVSFSVITSGKATQQRQKTLIFLGLGLGLMLIMLILALVLAVSHTDGAATWYALYALVGILAVASYTGLGSYLLWPQSSAWSSESAAVLFIGSIASQLQFASVLLLPRKPPRYWFAVVRACVLMTVVAALLYYLVDKLSIKLALLALTVPVSFVLMNVMAVRAWLQGNRIAKMWLLAYVPMHIIFTFMLVDLTGLVALTWFPFYAPIYAVVFEVPVLLVALHMHTKRKYGEEVRLTTLANIDPVTQFMNAASFANTIAQYWAHYSHHKQPAVLAYLKLAPPARLDAQEVQRAVVSIMRTVARQQDTVARLDNDVLALFMPLTEAGPSLANRLARVIALGLMVEQDELHVQPLRFRIAVGSLGAGVATPKVLEAALQAKIQQPDGWTKGPIQYLSLQPKDPHEVNDTGDTQAHMSAAWQQALEKSLSEGYLSPLNDSASEQTTLAMGSPEASNADADTLSAELAAQRRPSASY